MSVAWRERLRRPELVTESAFVDGVWLGGDNQIAVTNPATDRAIGSIPDLGKRGTEAAVDAAEQALHTWRQTGAADRAAILYRWHDLLLQNVSDLAVIMVTEQGKPLAEAEGEVRYAASFLKWFAEEARRSYGDVIPGHAPGKKLLVTRNPIGVVAAVTPWNFPLAMITRKAGPALAAGCTMVVKPSELTPFSALALARLADEAGVPPGVFNVVTGAPAAIGAVLTDDPRIRKFTFTGSTATGKMLAARCMATVKRVSLELGGNAPFLVFDDANLDTAVEGLVASKFRNSGQTCVCANRIYVQRSVYADFANRLIERVAGLRTGNGMTEGTTQGPLIDTRAVEKADRHVKDALSLGATLHIGGKAIEGSGNFYQPTVLTEVPPNALLCREETFGPVAGLVAFDSEEDGIALANNSEAGLAGYVFATGASRIARVVEQVEVGMVGVNTGLISTEVAPFGGIKQSGFGREGSRYGMDDYQEMKLVCLDVGGM